MAYAIALSDEQWELIADLFDPPGIDRIIHRNPFG
jgi:hypothetical protein